MDGVIPVYLDELLNFSLENSITHMFQAVTVLQQYFNAMCIFSYDTMDKNLT